MKDLKENVLVLTYWSYKDALIQTYTLPYVRMIKKNLSSSGRIFLVTLEQEHHKMSREEKEEIKALLSKENIEWHTFNYKRFGFTAGLVFCAMIIRLWWMIGQKDINTIHSWCMPAGGLGWILSKMTRKTLILDSYEPHAETMVEAGQWDQNSLAFRVLFWLEKKQSAHADTVIACVDSMRRYAKFKYNASFTNFYVKPAGVDFDLFHPRKRKNRDLVKEHGLEGKIVYVYAGKFGGSYLVDEVFALLKQAETFYENKFAAVLLNNHDESFIQEKAADVGLNPETIIHKFVPHTQVPDYMGLGDVGLVPFVPVPSKRFGSPIKTSEYLAMGIPIIITQNISDDSDIIEKNGLGSVLRSFDDVALLETVLKLNELIKNPEISEKARAVARQTKSFDLAEKVYKEVYS